MKKRSKSKKNQHKKRAIIIAVILLVVIAGIAAFFLTRNQEEPAPPATSQLTGLEVDDETSKRPILGIMVENSEAARPQTGLSSAGIVFEATTEGGITRYLGLYQEDQPKEVGPVRSLREHFLNWAMGFDASIAHVGGSAEALDLVEERSAKSLTQFRYPEPYYRSDSRPAPHNVYARLADLRNLQEELNHKQSSFAELAWSNDSPAIEPTATDITIDFSQPLYEARFQYNAESNTYQRFLAGEPHVDNATNKQIAVKNLVVIITNTQGNTPRTIGSGEALIFKNGVVQQVRWEKSGYDNRVTFIDNEGSQAFLNRGKTWITTITDSSRLAY